MLPVDHLELKLPFAQNGNTLVFRGFRYCHIRILLYLQAEITEIEERLMQCDKEDIVELSTVKKPELDLQKLQGKLKDYGIESRARRYYRINFANTSRTDEILLRFKSIRPLCKAC